ncbi:MAG: response regulator [Nitrospirae bacterium]|nr:response regulator [Nitrospirota bacterium]
MNIHDDHTPDRPILDPALAESASLFRSKIAELSLVRELADCGALLDDLEALGNAITGVVQGALQIDACALFGPEDGEGWRFLGGVSLDPCGVPPEYVAPNLLDLAANAMDGVASTGRGNADGVPQQLAVGLNQGARRVGVLVLTDPDAATIWNRRQDLLAIVTRQVATLADAAQMYHKVEDTNRYLEITLEQRTQSLKETQERLHQQEKLASLGQLVTGVSHELNNRLVPVLGYAQLLKAQELDGEARRAVDAIESAALGSKRIVDDMLSFARPVQPRPEPLQLGELLRQVAGNVAIAHDGPCPLKVLARDGVPMVAVDRQQVEQVFHNLIKNALEAVADRRDGNVRVTVGGDAGRVTVTIEDNGTGIPDDVQPRIFEPFFSTKAVGKGTGLGLSITHGLTRANGGTIRMESRNGIGTRFMVSFPALAEHAADDAGQDPEKHKVKYNRSQSTSFIKKTVLVVDDEPGIREFLAHALARDFEVRTAENGMDAQSALAGQGFDMILMDLRMPGLGGMELYRWLRAERPDLADVVVFMTGDQYDPETVTFLSERRNRQLRKPFTLSQLRGALGDA